MGDYTGSLAEVAADVLEPGEQLRVSLIHGSEVTFEIVENDGFCHLVGAFRR